MTGEHVGDYIYRADRCLEAHVPVSAAIYAEIQQFMMKEALLLDYRRFDQWLRLLSPQMHYRAMAFSTVDEAMCRPNRTISGPHTDQDYAALRERLLLEDLSGADATQRVGVRRLITNLTVSAAFRCQYECVTYGSISYTSAPGDTGSFTVVRHDRLLATRRTLRLVERQVIADIAPHEFAELRFLL
jgi:3-phenylpropionate/cinnamic acid dioxygenase small subunit